MRRLTPAASATSSTVVASPRSASAPRAARRMPSAARSRCSATSDGPGARAVPGAVTVTVWHRSGSGCHSWVSRGRLPLTTATDRSSCGAGESDLGAVGHPDAGGGYGRARSPLAPRRAGWDGITFTDSQNLVGDPFVAVALAAARDRAAAVRDRRHQRVHPPSRRARQRRGDGAGDVGRPLRARHRPGRHRAVPPRPQADAGRRVRRARSPTCRPTSPTGRSTATGTRAGCSGSTACRQPKVPLDIAASGPRMIEFAARIAERVTLAVGADPDRVAWALDLARKAAADAGRDPADDLVRRVRQRRLPSRPRRGAAALISGGVAAFAHFSSMPGSTGAGLAEADRAVVAEVGRRYDSNEHLSNTAAHTDALDARVRRPLRGRRPARRLRRAAARARRPRARAVRHHRRELRRRPRRTRRDRRSELLDRRAAARRCENGAAA